MQNDELREAQIKLEELKDKYLDLYDFAPVGYVTLNDKGLILDANLTAVGLLCVERQSLIKEPFSQFVCNEFRGAYYLYLQRVFETQSKQTCEIKLAREDGTHFYAQLESVAVQDESGRFNRCRSILSDITEQKRAEAWLRESEEKYRNLVETLSDAVFEVDRQGVITYCSPVVQHVLGYEPEDLMGRHHAEFVHSPDRDLLIKRFSELMQGIVHPLEYRMMTKSGEVRWVQSHTRPVMKGNTIEGARGTLADITERKKEQAALHRLATAVTQAAEAVVITNTDGTIQYVNPAFEKISGYRFGEIVGQNPRILKSGQQDRVFYENMWKTLKSGDTWKGRFVNKRKDGTLYQEDCTISPVRDRSGETVNFVAVKRDATHEAELQEQLVQAQKMEAIGTLAGGVAHDFNNILTIVHGFSELLLVEMEDEIPRMQISRRSESQPVGERSWFGAFSPSAEKRIPDLAPLI